jgi:isopentenyl phosphate kinase
LSGTATNISQDQITLKLSEVFSLKQVIYGEINDGSSLILRYE